MVLLMSEDEIFFKIEILYDFLDDKEKNEREIAKRISKNFKIPMEDALSYVKRYVEEKKKG